MRITNNLLPLLIAAGLREITTEEKSAIHHRRLELASKRAIEEAAKKADYEAKAAIIRADRKARKAAEFAKRNGGKP